MGQIKFPKKGKKKSKSKKVKIMFVNQKKSRAREIIYGINAALTAIETAPEKITAAWVVKGREDDKRIRQIEQKLQAVGIRAQVAMRHSLDEKTDNGVHQGIVLEVIATPPKMSVSQKNCQKSLKMKSSYS